MNAPFIHVFVSDGNRTGTVVVHGSIDETDIDALATLGDLAQMALT